VNAAQAGTHVTSPGLPGRRFIKSKMSRIPTSALSVGTILTPVLASSVGARRLHSSKFLLISRSGAWVYDPHTDERRLLRLVRVHDPPHYPIYPSSTTSSDGVERTPKRRLNFTPGGRPRKSRDPRVASEPSSACAARGKQGWRRLGRQCGGMYFGLLLGFLSVFLVSPRVVLLFDPTSGTLMKYLQNWSAPAGATPAISRWRKSIASTHSSAPINRPRPLAPLAQFREKQCDEQSADR